MKQGLCPLLDLRSIPNAADQCNARDLDSDSILGLRLVFLQLYLHNHLAIDVVDITNQWESRHRHAAYVTTSGRKPYKEHHHNGATSSPNIGSTIFQEAETRVNVTAHSSHVWGSTWITTSGSI